MSCLLIEYLLIKPKKSLIIIKVITILNEFLLIDLMTTISCNNLVASFDEALSSFLDKIFRDVNLPGVVDLVHQLLSRHGHGMGKHMLLQ